MFIQCWVCCLRSTRLGSCVWIYDMCVYMLLLFQLPILWYGFHALVVLGITMCCNTNPWILTTQTYAIMAKRLKHDISLWFMTEELLCMRKRRINFLLNRKHSYTVWWKINDGVDRLYNDYSYKRITVYISCLNLHIARAMTFSMRNAFCKFGVVHFKKVIQISMAACISKHCLKCHS